MRKIKLDYSYIVILVYAIFSTFFSTLISTDIYRNIINPLFWILFGTFMYINNNKISRFSNRKEITKTLIILILLYIILYFSSGLIFGYAHSPYSHNILVILKNIWEIIVPIIGIEITRYIVSNKNKNSMLMLTIITTIFILIEFNLPIFINKSINTEGLFKNICQTILPLIFSNIMFTYLTIKGSYKVVLVYRIIIELFYLLCPIFPDYNWFLTGTIGIIIPVVFIIIINSTDKIRNNRKDKKNIKKSVLTTIPLVVFLLIFILFLVGTFRYEPIAILSNSMVPIFSKGDIVIYEKITNEELKNIEPYTIIIYDKDDQLIIHRVVDKWETNGKTFYLTKGDANPTNDADPVGTDQIVGIYKFSIKYIGYPSVWLSEFFNKTKPVVQTGSGE